MKKTRDGWDLFLLGLELNAPDVMREGMHRMAADAQPTRGW